MTPLLDRLQALALHSEEFEPLLPHERAELLAAVPLLIQTCRAAAEARSLLGSHVDSDEPLSLVYAAWSELDAALAPLTGSGDSGE